MPSLSAQQSSWLPSASTGGPYSPRQMHAAGSVSEDLSRYQFPNLSQVSICPCRSPVHPFLGSRRVIVLKAEGQASREGVRQTRMAAGRKQQWETKKGHKLTTALCMPVLRTPGMCWSHWGSAGGMQPALHSPYHLLQEACKGSAHRTDPCLL